MLDIRIQINPTAGVDIGLLDIAIAALRDIRAHSQGQPFGVAAEIERMGGIVSALGGTAVESAPAESGLVPAVPVPPALSVVPSVAPPAPPVPPSMFPTPTPAPAPHAAPPVPGNEQAPSVDGSGLPWDGRIHSSNKKLTGEGVWQRRRNVPDAEFSRVVAELRQRGSFGAPLAPPASAATAPVAPVPPVPPAPTAPPAPPVPPVPTAAPTPPAVNTPTFVNAMARVAGNQKLFNQDLLKLWLASEPIQLAGIHELSNPAHADKLALIWSWMDQTESAGA